MSDLGLFDDDTPTVVPKTAGRSADPLPVKNKEKFKPKDAAPPPVSLDGHRLSSVLDSLPKIKEAPPDKLPQPLSILDAVSKRAPQFPWQHPDLTPECAAFVEDFYMRGHRLLTRDGKLFVSNAKTVFTTDDEYIKEVRPLLLKCAEDWPEERRHTVSVSSNGGGEAVSLAQMMGHVSNDDWKAQEPPVLDGIIDIIVNFETNGLHWYRGDRPIGVTVGTLDGMMKRFLPFAFRGGGGNLDENVVKRWASEQLKGKNIYNTNTRFDVHMSREWGVDLEEQGNHVSDVQHWAALLDDHRKRFKLDVLAQDYLGKVEVGRVDESQMQDYAPSQVAPRAEYQAQLIVDLHKVMWPQLDAQNLQRVRALEDDVIFATCEMEKNGAPLDMPLVNEYHDRCDAKHKELMWEIVQECGFAFDHTNAMWQKLFEYCHVPIRASDKKKASFAEDYVKTIKNPLIEKAHLAGQYASLNSKTFSAYKRLVGSDGILHFDINQLKGEDGGTVSGRFSVGYVQQVPNKDNHFEAFGDDLYPRQVFVSGDPMMLYFAVDAEQIEYRIFASLAKNPKVLEAYRKDPRASFHKMIWELVKRSKPDMLYTHQKSMNFLNMYGGGIVKLGVKMEFITPEEGAEIDEAGTKKTDPRLKPVRDIVAIYDREMPEVKPLTNWASHLAMSKCGKYCRPNDELHRKFQHQGFVETVMGRRSRFTSDYKLYIAINRIIQGGAADINKAKLVELNKAKKKTGFVLRMTVHDEVCGSVPSEESAEMVMEILNRQSFPEFVVPILWKGEMGRTWADCK